MAGIRRRPAGPIGGARNRRRQGRQRLAYRAGPWRRPAEVLEGRQAPVDFGHRGPRPVQGQPPQPIVENNQQTDVFPTGISQFTLDEDAREIYIAHWKRILVYDYEGKFKRGW